MPKWYASKCDNHWTITEYFTQTEVSLWNNLLRWVDCYASEYIYHSLHDKHFGWGYYATPRVSNLDFDDLERFLNISLDPTFVPKSQSSGSLYPPDFDYDFEEENAQEWLEKDYDKY